MRLCIVAQVLYFRPRSLLNLELQDQLESASPIMACEVCQNKMVTCSHVLRFIHTSALFSS